MRKQTIRSWNREATAETVFAMATRHPQRYRKMLRRLRQAREEAGMSQVDVAAVLKTSQVFVSRVEIGERRIDPVELLEFAELYGKPLAFFLDIASSREDGTSGRRR